MDSRRDFIKKAGWLAAGFTSLQFTSFSRQLLLPVLPLHNIPPDKNINPAWLKSIYKRGAATRYLKSKNELRYIGMPVGGLHAGTVYVGGDGRLWLWQIYNETCEGSHEGIDTKGVKWNDGATDRLIQPRDGAAYVDPAIANNKRILEQGFAIQVKINGKTYIKELCEDHWEEIIFKPAYPLAEIEYHSSDFPVGVLLQVYSPFIPLDANNSALPATILNVKIQNTSANNIEVQILGWMENGVNKLSGKAGIGKRVNTTRTTGHYTQIISTFERNDGKSQMDPDSGTMCFTLHEEKGSPKADLSPWPVTAADFSRSGKLTAECDAGDKLVSGISVKRVLPPNRSFTANYSVSWHFNHPNQQLKGLVKDAADGFYYGKNFADAVTVSEYLDANFAKLSSKTLLWVQTWNDSSLPHWFLERTFINIGTLATANTYRFSNGRFWSWEGVGACPGTCTHVWQYAQAMARIFPELERDMRERVDLGVGFNEETGAIMFRGENESRPAIDGQAGTILRFYREHQMCADNEFLKRNWPKIKKATSFLLRQDKNGDGMTDTPMENTLDAVWEGEIAWIVGLSLAAVSAAKEMATEMRDTAFAAICETYLVHGRQNMEKLLFNGEYFIHRPDAVKGKKELGSYNTCHIDQVYGQSWAFQVGLPRIISKEKAVSALKALWKYNFTTDVGPYIKTHTGGRPYALAGDGGMIMNSNPGNDPRPYGENTTWQLGYFHECMSGFEHQVAAHLMAEGMTDESLILTHLIHDRYHAAKRNPFNEIECSDHYARAMASYGTFISACGFEYHGPKGYIKFAPKINKTDFKSPFTAAEGWGSYTQKYAENRQTHQIEVKYGKLELKKIAVENLGGHKGLSANVLLENEIVPATFLQEGNAFIIYCRSKVVIREGKSLIVTFA